MRCFGQLVKSGFMATAVKELQQARLGFKHTNKQAALKPLLSYSADLKSKYVVYKSCVDRFNLVESMAETLAESPKQLHYIKIDYILFAFCRSKSTIEEACSHSYNVNGDIPFYRGQHIVAGKKFYTALIDTRFPVDPSSPN